MSAEVKMYTQQNCYCCPEVLPSYIMRVVWIKKTHCGLIKLRLVSRQILQKDWWLLLRCKLLSRSLFGLVFVNVFCLSRLSMGRRGSVSPSGEGWPTPSVWGQVGVYGNLLTRWVKGIRSYFKCQPCTTMQKEILG